MVQNWSCFFFIFVLFCLHLYLYVQWNAKIRNREGAEIKTFAALEIQTFRPICLITSSDFGNKFTSKNGNFLFGFWTMSEYRTVWNRAKSLSSEIVWIVVLTFLFI